MPPRTTLVCIPVEVRQRELFVADAAHFGSGFLYGLKKAGQRQTIDIKMVLTHVGYPSVR
jgi:hypothetical protein